METITITIPKNINLIIHYDDKKQIEIKIKIKDDQGKKQEFGKIETRKVRKGDIVILKGHPCKIVDIATCK